MNDLAAAIDHAAACHERALDRMTEAGIPLAEAAGARRQAGRLRVAAARLAEMRAV